MKIKLKFKLCLFYMIFCLNIYAADKIVMVTVPESEPHKDRVDEKVLSEIFSQLNIDLEIKYFPWNRCLEMVENKKADGMFCVKKTEDREKFMIFPKEGLVESEWVFFHRKDKNLEYINEQSLKGKIIAATTGYAYGDSFWKNSEIKIDEGYDDIVNMKKVINGRVDFFLCNRYDGEKILNDINNSEIIYSKKPFMSYPLYVGLSKKVGNIEIAEKISEKISEFKKNGKYKKIKDSIETKEKQINN